MQPDWVVEILSPEQSQTKVTKKILHCLDYGTEIGWLIDPAEQTVLIYLPKQQTMIFDQLKQALLVLSFAGELELKTFLAGSSHRIQNWAELFHCRQRM